MTNASIWNPGSEIVPIFNANENVLTEKYTATQGQSVFTIADFLYTVGNNSIAVYLNGVKQIVTTDYVETSTSSITMNFTLVAGDVVELVGTIGVVIDADATLLQSKLANETDVTLGAAMIGYTDPVAPAFLKTQSDINNGVAVSIFRFMTTAQIADIQAATASIDVAPAINNAILSLGTSGRAGALQFGGGKYLIGSPVNFSTVGSVPVSILGAGRSKTRFQRAPAFTVGDMFFLDTIVNPLSAWAELKDFSILNSGGVINSGYGIHVKNRECVNIANVFIYEGFGGYWLDGAVGQVNLTKCLFEQSPAYTTLGPSEAGYKQQGLTSAILIDSCGFLGASLTSANCLSYGMYIAGSDGMQVQNCFASAGEGVHFAGGSGFNIDDVYFTNMIIDAVRTIGVSFQGINATTHVYTNIKFNSCHINPRVDGGQQTVGVQIVGDCDNILFQGCNINLAGSYGVQIVNANNYSSVPRQSIKFANCDITGNDVNNNGIGNVQINSQCTGISFIDCDMFNRTGSAGNTTYAMEIGSGVDDIKIIGCKMTPNISGSIAISGTPPIHAFIKDNLGHNNVVRTIASAATIALNTIGNMAGDVVNISGSTAISNITGGWIGRTVLLYCPSGCSFNSGGNIAVTHAVAAQDGISLTYDGALWRAAR